MLDPFYTPDDLAQKVVSLYNGPIPRLIGDFCAGDGGLLRASAIRFPQANYFANDKSKRAYHNLLKYHSDWEVRNIDFLNDKCLHDIAHLNGAFDLLLLNPPFTCKGQKYKIIFDGLKFSASKALLFLVRSIRFLARGGRLLAVLPIGVSISERDADLMSYLKSVYGFHIHRKISGVSFAGKEPNVILAELCRPATLPAYTPRKVRKQDYGFLHRGTLNVVNTKNNMMSKKGIAFIHTTNLVGGKIVEVQTRVSPHKTKVLVGPAVLVPRVGNPNIDKVVVIGEGKKCVLSDCVIAILSSDASSAYYIKSILHARKEGYYRLYAGTGAKYITLSRFGKYLKKVVLPQYMRNHE